MAKTYSFNTQKYKDDLAEIAPNLDAIQQEALRRMQGGSLYSDERYKPITDYYAGQYLEGAQQRTEDLQNLLRARGQFDSGRLGERMNELAKETETQLQEGVYVPFALEQMRQRDQSEQAALQQAADISQQGIQNYQTARAQGLNEFQANEQNRLAEGDRTGILQTTVTRDDLLPSGGNEAAGLDAFYSLYGRAPTEAERLQLLNGEAVTVGVQTLAGKQFDLDATSQQLQDALDRAAATGQFVDPDTGLSTDTLSKWQMQLQEAQITGTLDDGTPTLAKLAQDWDQEFQEKATFGYDRTDADGNLILDANGQPIHVYGTNELALVMQQNEQEFAKMLEAGFTYTDPVTGEERRVLGTDERIQDEREWAEIQRVGYDRALTTEDGNPILDADGRPVVQHIEGTQELQARLRDRELELQEKGMDLDDAHRQALLEWEMRQYGGYYQVRSFDYQTLGLGDAPIDKFVNDDGTVDLQGFFQWADQPEAQEMVSRAESLLGRSLTNADIQLLVTGQSLAAQDANGNAISEWVPGSAGLEQARMQLQETLQQNGFDQETSERLANQQYEDKVREGYWTRDARTGQWRIVMGTQDYEEHILTIQNQLGITRDEAIWKLEEQTRVGYSQIQTVQTPSGPRQITVRVQGTQDFQASMQDRQDQLVRDGWDEDAARQQAAFEHEMDLEYGFYRTVDTPSGPRAVWVDGRQEHEESMQEMQNQLVRDGWAADEAARQAQYIRSQATQDLTYLGQQFRDERKWYYENVQGMTSAEASAAAMEDWANAEDGFGQQMQVELERMRLDAAENRFEAQAALEMRASLVRTAATVGAELLTDYLMPNPNIQIPGMPNRDGGYSLTDWAFNQMYTGQMPGPSGNLLPSDRALAVSSIVNFASQNGMTITQEEAGYIFDSGATSFGAGGQTMDLVGLRQAYSFTPQQADAYNRSYGGTPPIAGASWGSTLTGMAAIAYASYRTYQAMTDAEEIVIDAAAESTYAPYVERFNRDFTALPLDSQRRFRQILSSNSYRASTGAFDESGNIIPPEGSEDARAFQNAVQQAVEEGIVPPWITVDESRLTREQLEEQVRNGWDVGDNHWAVNMGQVSADMRELLDAGVFAEGMDAGSLTRSQRDMVESLWEAMPGAARSKNVTNSNEATLEEKLADLGRFGKSAGVMATDILRSSWESLKDSGILAKDYGDFTVEEEGLINRIWEQAGGREWLPFQDRVNLLRGATGISIDGWTYGVPSADVMRNLEGMSDAAYANLSGDGGSDVASDAGGAWRGTGETGTDDAGGAWRVTGDTGTDTADGAGAEDTSLDGYNTEGIAIASLSAISSQNASRGGNARALVDEFIDDIENPGYYDSSLSADTTAWATFTGDPSARTSYWRERVHTGAPSMARHLAPPEVSDAVGASALNNNRVSFSIEYGDGGKVRWATYPGGQQVYEESLSDFADRNGVAILPTREGDWREQADAILASRGLTFSPDNVWIYNDGEVRITGGGIRNGTYEHDFRFSPSEVSDALRVGGGADSDTGATQGQRLIQTWSSGSLEDWSVDTARIVAEEMRAGDIQWADIFSLPKSLQATISMLYYGA